MTTLYIVLLAWLWGVVMVAVQMLRQEERGQPWHAFVTAVCWPVMMLATMVGMLAEWAIDNSDGDR